MVLPLGETKTKSLNTKGGKMEMMSQEESAPSKTFLISVILERQIRRERIARMEATPKLFIIFVIKGGKWISRIKEKRNLLRKRRIMANDKSPRYFKAFFNLLFKANP